MSLALVVDDVAAHLAAGGIDASDLVADDTADLPAVVIAVEDATRPSIGIGGIPDGPQRGALVVSHDIDLATPTLASGRETIDLLDADRLVLVVPNGPLVTAAGSEGPPFGAADVTVVGPGAPWTLTNNDPNGSEFRVDPDSGTIEFGTPLAAAGTLIVTTHVGVWDVTTIRYRGILAIDVIADGTDAAGHARSVADRLTSLPVGFTELTPTAWGTAEPFTTEPTAPAPDSLRRRLAYSFVYDRIIPVVPTSGGVIRTVDTTSDTDGEVETFEIPIPSEVPA